MKDMLLSNGGWLLRVLTVSVLVTVIALSLFPRVVSHISTSAIINAPILIIRSPVEGVVEDYALQSGTLVSRGQDIAVFREAGTDLTQRVELEARLTIAEAAIAAVNARIGEVEDIRRSLEARHRVYREWQSAILENEVEELEAQLRGAKARLSALEQDVERTSALHERNMIADSEKLERATQLTEQIERVREITARRSAKRLQLRALQDDILAGTEGTNTSYTLQRQDEVKLELARLRDELVDHSAEYAALQEQLARAQAIYDRDNRITLSSPIDGIVWRSAASSGRPVLPGDEIVEILDCRARYLEAYLPEGLMGTVAAGDLAEVRLTGGSQTFSAPIVSILGNGARFDHAELAAQDTAPKAGKMRVIIALTDEMLALDRGKFCHVGRTAQVSLPRDLASVSRLADRFLHGMKTAFAWLGSSADDVQRG